MPAKRYHRPSHNQAQRIIRKFGGARRLAALLGRTPSGIYKWAYKRPAGRGGVIPAPALKEVIKAAKKHGIIITTEDLYPELPLYSGLTPKRVYKWEQDEVAELLD
jgi:hypothetical protein